MIATTSQRAVVIHGKKNSYRATREYFRLLHIFQLTIKSLITVIVYDHISKFGIFLGIILYWRFYVTNVLIVTYNCIQKHKLGMIYGDIYNTILSNLSHTKSYDFETL